MRKIPHISLLSLFVFVGLNLFAQTSTVIKSDNNGKLNYAYSTTSNNSFSIQIVFKNESLQAFLRTTVSIIKGQCSWILSKPSEELIE